MRLKTGFALWLRRVIIVLLIPALTIFNFSTPVFADRFQGYELHGHKLIGGISTVLYGWYNPYGYTSPAGTAYYSLIMNAQNDWESALAQTTQTDFQTTSYSNENCKIIFIINNTENDDVYAGVRFFTASGNPIGDAENFGLPTADYAYCYVICYHQNLSTATNDNQVKAVFAHETGHVLGLAHVTPENGKRAIMEDPIWNTGISTPQENDVVGVDAVGY